LIARERLLDQVWEYDGAPLTRTVDHARGQTTEEDRNRSGRPEHIVTVHRMGYKFTG
jgi:DNA-binding response OmpR family regulator